MKLIVGLGNPGAEYERTRHNAGFLAVDRLIDRHAPGAVARSRFHALAYDVTIRRAGAEERALLLKPTTFMNRSGLAVAEAARFYKLLPAEDVLVLVDDVALPIGAIRMRAKGGTGGHNGLADIQQKLGSDDYARLRIGVGSPGRATQRDYVLGRFSAEQWEDVRPALDRAADAAEVWATEGPVAAMNAFNAPDEARESAIRSDASTNDTTPDAAESAPAREFNKDQS